MSNDDYIHAAWIMEKMGGGFASLIAKAYYAADGDNQTRLRQAFPELFTRYHQWYLDSLDA